MQTLKERNMGRKHIIALLATLAITLCMAGAALAKNIAVINGTSFEIHAIAVSASESDNWGDDLLGNTVLAPGEGLEINLSGSNTGWDMAVVDPSGQQLEFKNLDFSNYSKVTLFSDGTARLE